MASNDLGPQIWEVDEATGGYKSDEGNYLLRRDVLSYLNALEAKTRLLPEALAALKEANEALLYIANRERDEHLEDVANNAIDAIANLQAQDGGA